MSLYLGLRAKELAALQWADVFDGSNEVREQLSLKAAYTKGSKSRNLFISAPRLRNALRDYGKQFRIQRRPDSALFISQRGGNMTAGSMARMLKQLYVEAGLPEASSHTGRRTFITSLAERGIDLKSIAVLAGHSNIKTTALYVDASPKKLSRILSGLTY